MKKISIVAACYNEESNIDILYEKIKEQMDKFESKYEWEIIYIDNCSTDSTVEHLRKLASQDKHVKVILNSRNYGHIRSPFYGLINAYGDAVITIASDLQDPPELISQFINKWEEGYKLVLGQKTSSDESFYMYQIRKLYYFIIGKIADDNTEQLRQFTGTGLYDKCVVDVFRTYDDPYPYFRGMVSEVGFEKAFIPFNQPKRKNGITKNNFYTLYDMAMLGIVKHSKIPLRLVTFIGFLSSFICLFTALFYFIYKLLFWQSFEVGMAPLVIGLFFFASVQLFVVGIVGEYVGAIYTRVDKKPLVIEKERINF